MITEAVACMQRELQTVLEIKNIIVGIKNSPVRIELMLWKT